VETVERAFEPYRHLDPIGWIGLFRFIPPLMGLAVAVIGSVTILFGGRRLFRLVAGPLGALVAVMWAGTLAARLGFGTVQRQLTVVSTFVLLGAGFLFPPITIFFAFGVPVGLVAGELAGPADWLLGFARFIAGGATGVCSIAPGGPLSSTVGGVGHGPEHHGRAPPAFIVETLAMRCGPRHRWMLHRARDSSISSSSAQRPRSSKAAARTGGGPATELEDGL
jgi:hypothetical protein